MYDLAGNYVSATSVAHVIADSQIPFPHGAGFTCPDSDGPCWVCDPSSEETEQ